MSASIANSQSAPASIASIAYAQVKGFGEGSPFEGQRLEVAVQDAMLLYMHLAFATPA